MSELKQNRDPNLVVSRQGTIGFYEREFYMFSNFSSFQVDWRGAQWMTSEHAYHAAKYIGVQPEIVAKIGLARSAHDAFKFSRKYTADIRPDWLDIRLDVMKDICRHKLGQHAYIRTKLDETSGWNLVEDSPKDSFWGIGADGQGENQLGKIWMMLREEMRNGIVEIQS